MRHTVFLFLIFCSAPLRADFQYQSTAQMTGGTMLQMLRFVPGSGKLREPQVSTVAVHGNRMLHKGVLQTQIIDLDKRTITTINYEKRTYSVMTFEQMKQAIEQMNAKLEEQKKQQPGAPDINVDFKVESTGQAKNIDSYNTKESVFTMSMNMTDPRTGQNGAMNLKLDMWIAPEVAGYSEVRDFYKRMGKEIDWAPGGMTLMARPDIARATAKMMTQGGIVDGTPIQDVMSIEPVIPPGVAQQNSQQSTSQQNSIPSTPGSAIAGALAGRLGGFGGFGKKKQATQDTPAAGSDTSLMQMTMQNSNFSAAPVDLSLFEIPAGYKEVAPDLPRAAH